MKKSVDFQKETMYNVSVIRKENEMKKISAYEYDDLEDVIIFDKNEPMYVYLSDNEENPFVGVEYDDGRFSIVGLGMDSEVDYEEMCAMLYEEV